MARFADHFSDHAGDYAVYRPSYPRPLIEHLAGLCPVHELAWDVGTGSGQAAVLLAPHFARVVATDASPQQIQQAQSHPRVTYRVALEDASGLEPMSVDLVTVAQALHWFDLPRFYREVRRVSRPEAIIAVWCYGRGQIDSGVDPIFDLFYSQRVARYWPPERCHIENEYRDLEFPFEELPSEAWAMTMRLTRSQFLGYVGTWSAVAKAREVEGADPVEELARDLSRVWRDEEDRRTITWPVVLRVGRASSSAASRPVTK